MQLNAQKSRKWLATGVTVAAIVLALQLVSVFSEVVALGGAVVGLVVVLALLVAGVGRK